MKNEDKLKKLPELWHSFLYNDVGVMQSYEIFNSYPELFENENFERVIEIGTAFGGLPLFIRNCLGFEKQIITYDITDHLNNWPQYLIDQSSWSTIPGLVGPPPDISLLLKESNIDFRPGKDVFSPSTTNEIIKLMQETGKTLLICDGGNKAREINLFSKYLKSGDVILGHDYFKDGILDRNIWSSCELSLQMIIEETTKNNINNDNQYSELFQKSATYIGIKN